MRTARATARARCEERQPMHMQQSRSLYHPFSATIALASSLRADDGLSHSSRSLLTLPLAHSQFNTKYLLSLFTSADQLYFSARLSVTIELQQRSLRQHGRCCFCAATRFDWSGWSCWPGLAGLAWLVWLGWALHDSALSPSRSLLSCVCFHSRSCLL